VLLGSSGMQYVKGTINTLVEARTRVIRSVFVEVLFKPKTQFGILNPTFSTHVVSNRRKVIRAGCQISYRPKIQKGNRHTRVDVDEDDRGAKGFESSAVLAYNHVQTSLADGISVTYVDSLNLQHCAHSSSVLGRQQERS
jgi:hypothetical protein